MSQAYMKLTSRIIETGNDSWTLKIFNAPREICILSNTSERFIHLFAPVRATADDVIE